MMDKLGQYANILYITQSLTFKTFKTHNTFHPWLAAACWKDWFNRLQINDSFLSSFWLQHLQGYGNYQLTGIYYYIQDPSVWLLGNMCRLVGSGVNTFLYLQTEPPTPRKPMLWKSHRVSQMIAQLMDLRSYRCWLWWAYWVIWGDLWILIDLDRSHCDINTEPLIPNLINKDTRWGYWETFKDFNFIIFISISLHVRIMATTSRPSGHT